MKYEWSGVLLITPNNELIAMRRDDKPKIRDPGCYGIFGGAAEGDESPVEAAMREINEETNLKPSVDDLKFFKVYLQERDNIPEPAKLSIFILENVDPDILETYEGQGTVLLRDASSPKIAKDIKEVFEDWFKVNPN